MAVPAVGRRPLSCPATITSTSGSLRTAFRTSSTALAARNRPRAADGVGQPNPLLERLRRDAHRRRDDVHQLQVHHPHRAGHRRLHDQQPAAEVGAAVRTRHSSRRARPGSISTTARTRAPHGGQLRSATPPGNPATRSWATATAMKQPSSPSAPTPTTSSSPPISANSFTVADPSAVSALSLKLLRDDGAVVYLNGTEVYRNNMPSGSISSSTLASSSVEDNTYLHHEHQPVAAESAATT